MAGGKEKGEHGQEQKRGKELPYFHPRDKVFTLTERRK